MIVGEEAARAWLGQRWDLSSSTSAKLDVLVERLREENTRQNLISRGTIDNVWQRHICDSAQLLTYVPRETTSTWLDLGTGAGFPGLVIATLEPGINVTMVESRSRRVDWLGRITAELALTNTTILGQRLERIDSFHADVISARAFAPLAPLLDLAARFSTKSTLWLLPKGRSAAQELSELEGWRHTFHVEQSLTDPDAGIVVGTLANPERL
jgi:16S rRNA (guanine527-N7)-methyltransferase